jgi:putative ABC transport system permease protein
MCAIFVLSLLTLIYAFGIYKNVLKSYENDFNDYFYAVGVTTKSEYFTENPFLIIGNDLVKSLALSEYVKDYYVLEEIPASSTSIKPMIPSNVESNSNNYFQLALYSNINKSVDFVTGKRKITEGRYAASIGECNISTNLAELNGLGVGSTISVNLWNFSEKLRLNVVGLFSDSTNEVCGEFDFLSRAIDKKSSEITTADSGSIRRNDILAVSETINNVKLMRNKTAFYYIHNENAVYSFKEQFARKLPDSLTILDSLGTMQFIRKIIEGTSQSYIWLSAITGIICSIFYVLLIFHIFKSRTYDIGVLRTRGLSRINTALLFACEVFIASTTAFIIAGLLYFITFKPLTSFLYEMQRIFINDIMWYHPAGVDINIANTVLAYNFNVSLSAFELACGFIMSIIFAVVIGLASVLYISRNEPMKTMVEF